MTLILNNNENDLHLHIRLVIVLMPLVLLSISLGGKQAKFLFNQEIENARGTFTGIPWHRIPKF